MGDPNKAATAMINLIGHPNPPVHLVLGSEAVAILKQADAARKAELETWESVSLSTDHQEAINFLDTEQGQSMFNR